MYTYEDIDCFKESLQAVALLKIAYDNGVDLRDNSELAIDLYSDSVSGYCDKMYYFQEIIANTFEIVEYISKPDEDEVDEDDDFHYWLSKVDYDTNMTSDSTIIILLMDDRLSKPESIVYTTSFHNDSWSSYFDVAHLDGEKKAVIVFFDYENGEPEPIEALQYLFACLSTEKVVREDKNYAVAN